MDNINSNTSRGVLIPDGTEIPFTDDYTEEEDVTCPECGYCSDVQIFWVNSNSDWLVCPHCFTEFNEFVFQFQFE